MRTTILVTLAIVAGLTATPARASAQGKELPCVAYATFEKKGAITELIGLAIGQVPSGSKVQVMCTGVDCPFWSREFSIKNDVGMIALTDMFTDPNLKPGMILELRVTKPAWIGKTFQYEIRAAVDPKSTEKCVSEDGSKTVVCEKDK